jgi:hypothetical protein
MAAPSTLLNRFLHPRNLFTPSVFVAAAGIIAAAVLGIGWANSASHATKVEQHAAKVQSELKNADDEIGVYAMKAASSAAAQKAAEKKQSSLDAKIAAANALKAQLEQEQQTVVASQMTDGVHVVGTDTQPGTYSITSSTDCYYAWMSGTDANASIISNNIVSGPATVTLKAGDTFDTNRCGTWTKVG